MRSCRHSRRRGDLDRRALECHNNARYQMALLVAAGPLPTGLEAERCWIGKLVKAWNERVMCMALCWVAVQETRRRRRIWKAGVVVLETD
ncbi:hypothetical protein EJB05_13734 [Eragrostis curvula]|uniref:Uncharacterized protein n=1 Tax=Eragrostis curvula TaxID=38414 RepID=A0A5J9VWG5_9POAL|nr:hypothetical protein EJB05_13734 [Eragrostis curvula]